MSDLDDFVERVAACAPAVGTELDRRRDPELDSAFGLVGTVGSSVARVWAQLAVRERDAVLAVAERAMADGSEDLRTAVATNFLEALAHAVSRGEVPGPELAEHLGPTSRAYVDAYDQWSLGRSSLESR